MEDPFQRTRFYLSALESRNMTNKVITPGTRLALRIPIVLTKQMNCPPSNQTFQQNDPTK